MRHRAALLALLLGACSNGGAAGDSTSGGEAGDDSTCGPTGERRETETEVCTCGPQSFCGGIQRSDDDLMRMERTLVWHCHPRRPPACDEARRDEPCGEEGLECPLFDCCGDVMACEGGVWVEHPGPCPA